MHCAGGLLPRLDVPGVGELLVGAGVEGRSRRAGWRGSRGSARRPGRGSRRTRRRPSGYATISSTGTAGARVGRDARAVVRVAPAGRPGGVRAHTAMAASRDQAGMSAPVRTTGSTLRFAVVWANARDRRGCDGPGAKRESRRACASLPCAAGPADPGRSRAAPGWTAPESGRRTGRRRARRTGHLWSMMFLEPCAVERREDTSKAGELIDHISHSRPRNRSRSAHRPRRTPRAASAW